jgi:alkanesulfonate monooxygenase SsuD/methylene tetrahydromethanopterin reductase-like flavin-dependent oxidoreductase (luciferase family)
MEFGLQLPTSIPGVTRDQVLAWARFIDDGPFASMGAPDRLVYANLDPLIALSAAAAVTTRVRVATTGIIGGLRGRAAFAKAVRTLSVLAPGRLSLGVVIGARENDFAVAGEDFRRRGKLLDEHLDFLTSTPGQCRDDTFGPPLDDIEILIGGGSPGALRRIVRFGHGYVSGGIKPKFFASDVSAVEAAWKTAGRQGRPRIVAGMWFASSVESDDDAARHHASYFAIGGPPAPVDIGIVRGRGQVLRAIAEFEKYGANEVMFWPLVDDLSEAHWLADVVSDHR